jgi:hypothetical protein
MAPLKVYRGQIRTVEVRDHPAAAGQITTSCEGCIAWMAPLAGEI